MAKQICRLDWDAKHTSWSIDSVRTTEESKWAIDHFNLGFALKIVRSSESFSKILKVQGAMLDFIFQDGKLLRRVQALFQEP